MSPTSTALEFTTRERHALKAYLVQLQEQRTALEAERPTPATIKRKVEVTALIAATEAEIGKADAEISAAEAAGVVAVKRAKLRDLKVKLRADWGRVGDMLCPADGRAADVNGVAALLAAMRRDAREMLTLQLALNPELGVKNVCYLDQAVLPTVHSWNSMALRVQTTALLHSPGGQRQSTENDHLLFGERRGWAQTYQEWTPRVWRATALNGEPGEQTTDITEAA